MVLKFLPPSDVAHELNEMVLSQGMLDLRSFGYGHRYNSKFKLNLFYNLILTIVFFFQVLDWYHTIMGERQAWS